MRKNDAYFRAFTEYKKETDKQPECVKLKKVVAESNTENDLIETERAEVTVKEDWIEEIEKGLVFVEKALKEERQFIRTNGEVLPIEKVKHVSKDSVEHLAKHSDLLTREPKDGGDIIPDKVFTVEKLSDYAVYENRFLYMMLCYLRDFIELRYTRILNAVNTYKGRAKIKKKAHSAGSLLNIELSLDEVINNDSYLAEHNDIKELLDRIDTIYKTVVVFLSYPLMQEVAKTPMIKPPVTKTNVLKMNHNFKGALALYEYVAAYDEDGYEIKQVTDKKVGFKGATAEDFAETIRALSFLTYQYGLGLTEDFKKEYEAEELRRKEEKARKLEEKKVALRKRAKEAGFDMEEYMLVLEKLNSSLEKDSDDLKIAVKQIEKLDKDVEILKNTVKQKNDEIVELGKKHEEEIAKLKAEHESEIEKLNLDFENRVAEINAAHESEIAAVKERAEAEIIAANKRRETEIAAAEQKVREKDEELLKQVEVAKSSKAMAEAVLNERTLMQAKINALRYKCKDFDGSERFDKEENFNEIEKQYKAFRAFFNDTWRKTRKTIRKKEKSEAVKEGLFEKKGKKKKEEVETDDFWEDDVATSDSVNDKTEK